MRYKISLQGERHGDAHAHRNGLPDEVSRHCNASATL
jgi:hypothetical protein